MNHQIGELRNFFHTITQRVHKIEEQLNRIDDKAEKALYGLDIIRDKQLQTDSLILDKNTKTLDESELRTIRILFGSYPASLDDLVPSKNEISDDILGQVGDILGGSLPESASSSPSSSKINKDLSKKVDHLE